MSNKKVLGIAVIIIAIMQLLVFPSSAESTATSFDSDDFVLVSDAVPDAILEIRYYSTYNFVGERIDGYEEPIAILTREAANALRQVSDDLIQRGYRLKIFDAYRPQSAVDHFIRWAKDSDEIRMKEYFYPELDKSVLFSRGYVSSRSGHSRGSTVDLTLFDISTGREIDMGGTFDYFGGRSHSDYAGITDEQKTNRMILRNAMLAHGFKGISTEWWHFTLMDEPFKNSYFDFPVAVASVQPQDNEEADAEQPLVLAEGMQGAEVKELQELLVITGYLTDSVDGSFGPKTKHAIMNFQTAHGLSLSGEVSEIEVEALLTEAKVMVEKHLAKALIETGLEGRLEDVSAAFEFVYDGIWSRDPGGFWDVNGALVRFPKNSLYALVSYRAEVDGARLVTDIVELRVLVEQ